MPYPTTPSEGQRPAALAHIDILDTAAEALFERVCIFAQGFFDVSICTISLVDVDRQWFSARLGLDIAQTPPHGAFFNYTLRDDVPFVVPDARRDRRFVDEPVVAGGPRVRFYAGVPLILRRDIRVGTLSLMDTAPHDLSPVDTQNLVHLAERITTELTFRALSTTRRRAAGDPLMRAVMAAMEAA